MNLTPALYQCDFKVYHDAAQAFLQGSNPYKNPSLGLPYVYPPITLFFFAFFGLFSFSTAIFVWALFKLCLWIGLGYLFYRSKHFNRILFAPLSLMVLVFAFQSPIAIDFQVGNITALECFLLWLGAISILEENIIIFALCVRLVSQFKIFTSLFALMPLFVFRTKGVRATIAASVSILFFASFNWIALSRLVPDFLSNQNPFMEMGLANPSSLGFARALTDWIAEKMPSPLWHDLAWVALVLFWGFQSIQILKNHGITKFDRMNLFFLFYALCLPRFKDYSYAILLPAAAVALHAILKERNFKKLTPLFILIFLPTSFDFLNKTYVTSIVANFYPYIALSILTFLWIKTLNANTKRDSQELT